MLVVCPQSGESRENAPLVAVRTRFRGCLIGAHLLRSLPTRRRTRLGSFVVGSSGRAHMPWPDGGRTLEPDHELLRAVPGGVEVCALDGMRATVRRGTERLLIDGGTLDAGTIEIPSGEIVELSSADGALRFEVELSDEVPAVPKPSWRPKRADLRATAAAGASILPLFLVLMMLPREPGALALNERFRDHRFLAVTVKPPALVVPPAQHGASHAHSAGTRGGGTPATASRGTPAKRRGSPPPGRSAIDPRRAGILGVLQGGALASLLSPDADPIPGGLEALQGLTTASGFYAGLGHGPPGTGAHGAGQGDGPGPGLGGYTTIGKGSGKDPGHGPRGPGGRLLDHRPGPVAFAPTHAEVVRGSLDKEIVRREIRRHLNEVKHCYDVALVKNPALAGRLVVRFFIDGRGTVTAAAVADGTTLDDARVGACVVAAFKRWQFPAPRGGGMVDARYPFVFMAPTN